MQSEEFMSSSSIGRRVDALEALGGVVDRGVAGIVHGRGQDFDPADEARVDQHVAELHAAGHSVVYVANLASRRPPVATPAATSEIPRS